MIERALIETRATDEHLSDVLLQVERGRLLGARGDAAATHALVGAIDAARSIGARDGELRAATSLATLLDVQRRTAEAREALEPIFSSFTEGLDTPDLVAARQVLERL